MLTSNLYPVQLEQGNTPLGHGHSGAENNEDANAVAMEGSNSSFLGPEWGVAISLCVDKFMIKDWLIKQHSWQSKKFFTEGFLEKLCTRLGQ
jgi:hypothetical protein